MPLAPPVTTATEPSVSSMGASARLAWTTVTVRLHRNPRTGPERRMAWDFETEPEFEEQLAWMRELHRP